MSVQTEIDRIITAVNAAHEKVAEKGGTTAQPYLVGNLASAIATIPGASEPVLQSKTVSPSTSSQTVKPDSGYDGLSQVTVNAMATATQATPSISVSSGGLITATATQSAGYVSAGTKSGTKQLTTQAAQTITPGTSNKTIASGRYLTGTQTIKGDANLVAGNIKSGVSIFGVAGTYEGSGGGSGGAVETCSVSIDISASTAYIIQYAALIHENNVCSIACNMTDNGHDSQTLTINNVVCGSTLYFSYSGPISVMSYSWIEENGLEMVSASNFDFLTIAKAPLTANATGILRLEKIDDGSIEDGPPSIG